MADNADVQNFEGDAHRMDLYSRQIGAYGVEAMAKLIKMKVVIVGLRGVGIEAAKNLVLAGPGAVTLVDDAVVQTRDLGTNFFLREADVGTNTRAAASAKHLQALNRLVDVKAHNGPLSEDLVRAHTALMLCNPTRAEALKWNKFCRANNVGFFLTGVHGLFGYAFVDLGDEFTIRDRNGEQPVSRIIDGIDVAGGNEPNEMIVHLIPPPDGRRHNIEDTVHEGWVSFDELEGDLGKLLNEKGPFRAHHVHYKRKDNKTGKTREVFDAYALRVVVPGVSKLPEFVPGGGLLNQVKVPEKVHFRSLEEACDQPVSPGEYSLLFTDGAKFGRPEQLHVALQGLWDWEESNGKLPAANDEAQTEQVIQASLARNKAMREKADKAMQDSDQAPAALALDEMDENVLKMVAQHAECEFQPLSTFFGGVLAQEVVKMTGKFTPLNQWLHIDCFEVLPEVEVDDTHPKCFKPTIAERAPIGSRYDDLIMILGRPLQESLMGKSTFMVGCGALGCELLKNFALLGLACGKGKLTVTDNDTIEVSNLSRQFLFREHNVGQPKSAAASDAVLEMNPALNVVARQDLVSVGTEHIFDDKFWMSLDFVTNALDNVKARLYVDSRCVLFEKALLESGTLGTKCNVQVVLPHLTASYADGPSDGDGGDAIPMCTLRNFPSQIEHCIEWARARFNDMFFTTATAARQFCENPDSWLEEMRSKTLGESSQGLVLSAVANEMEPVSEILELVRRAKSPDNCFAECVKEAYLIFHRKFRDNIVSLITTYPEDAKDNSGNPFWSGTKRFPQAAEFDVSDPTHMGFVISTANILAVNLGLQPADQPLPAEHPWRSPEHVAKIVSKLSPPAVVTEAVDMSGGGEDDAKDNKSGDSDDAATIKKFENMLKELESLKGETGDILIEAADFEKDADWNFHIDYITATSNLRAWNYRLKPASRHQSKMIAGKIIPALATTTASVTGLVMIEMIKAVQPGKKIEAFKDSSNSLGINSFLFSEPSPPEHAKDEYDPIEMSEVKCKPPGFTKWDKTVIEAGSLTVKGFMDKFREVTGLNCTDIFHASSNIEGTQGHSKYIYETNAWKKELKQAYDNRLSQPLEEVAFDVYGEAALPPGKKFIALEVSATDDNDDPFKVPSIVYRFA